YRHNKIVERGLRDDTGVGTADSSQECNSPAVLSGSGRYWTHRHVEHMRRTRMRHNRRVCALTCVALLVMVLAASAQVTTGSVAGTVADAQGGVIPGATVVLVSEARETRSAPAVTGPSGDFVFPNVTVGTYTIVVTMP